MPDIEVHRIVDKVFISYENVSLNRKVIIFKAGDTIIELTYDKELKEKILEAIRKWELRK